MGWKIATGALAVGLVVQFVWWNKRAPQVLHPELYPNCRCP